jgi:tyrosine aminotransferase
VIEARQAVVDKFSKAPDHTFTADDVYLTFGGHGALYLSISALCSRGENILVPKPSFPIIKPICDNLGVIIKYYDLLPD